MNELMKSSILRFSNKRIIPGLHKAPSGAELSADVNQYSIIRKPIPQAFVFGVESCVVQPRRITPLKLKAAGKSEMISRLA